MKVFPKVCGLRLGPAAVRRVTSAQSLFFAASTMDIACPYQGRSVQTFPVSFRPPSVHLALEQPRGFSTSRETRRDRPDVTGVGFSRESSNLHWRQEWRRIE